MQSFAPGALIECHIFCGSIFIGLVTSVDYNDDKARAFLLEMHNAVSAAKWHKTIPINENLEPNAFDEKLSSDFLRIYNNGADVC